MVAVLRGIGKTRCAQKFNKKQPPQKMAVPSSNGKKRSALLNETRNRSKPILSS
jgi:hypothetical protein